MTLDHFRSAGSIGEPTRSSSPFRLGRRRANTQVVQSIREAAHQLVRRRGLEAFESPFDFTTKSPYSDEDFGLGTFRPKLAAKSTRVRKRERRDSRNAEHVARSRLDQAEHTLGKGTHRKRNGG